LGQKPLTSLRKFVSHKAGWGKDPEATTRSPRDDEMDAAMDALCGGVRVAEKRDGKVELTLGDSTYVWNPIKSPSKLFTV
jgi:hypothetical protein